MKKLLFMFLLLLPGMVFAAPNAIFVVNNTTDLNITNPRGTMTYVNETDTVYINKNVSYEPLGNVTMQGHLVAYDHTQIGQGGTNSTFTILTLPGVIISNDTTLTNLTGMSFSFDANSNYTYDMYMICQSNITGTGYRFAVDTSVAVTGVYLNYYHQLANTGTLSGGSSIADNVSTGTTSGIATANATIPILGGGLLMSGANPGVAQFKFGSEAAGNSTVYTSCRAGSKIRVMKLD